ncbi:MAG: protease Do [Phycisphaerales bacterium]|jgi:serine protease Do|nr:protease Do [Phycisphaerales bacterium]
MNRLRKSVVTIVIVGGVAGAWFGGSALVRDVAFAQQERTVENTREQLATAADLSSAFRNVGKVIEPSVVQIQVRKTVKGAHKGMPFDEDMLRRFFPNAPHGAQPAPNNNGNGNDDENNADPNEDGSDGLDQEVGTGSGVIMEIDGKTAYILTNNHVAGGATEMVVTLADGTRITNAKLVGADAKSDLAVVKLDADHLLPAKWGDSSSLNKGDWILAFGSPFGYVGSMTHGIVSALDRQAGILGKQGYEDFIQVDAPINPGNSGGPLVNLHGEVVGINTAIASRSGGFQGIGFAIPSNEAKFVYSSLKAHGKVTRGWLGVSISDVARDLPKAQSFGYKGAAGVLVEQTFPNTPATGRLQAGDIIESLDGKPVKNVLELRNAVAATSPNTDVKMNVFRDGKDQDVTLKIGEQPEDLTAVAAGHGTAHGTAGGAAASAEALGMNLTNPSDQLAEKYGFGDVRNGALVTRVQPRSAAERAGIRPGDVITKVGGANVNNAKEAGDALGKSDAAKKGVRLYINSVDGSRFVFVEPQQQ